MLRQLIVFHTDLHRFVTALQVRLGPQLQNVPLLYEGAPELQDILSLFGISVEMEELETNWEYEIPGLRFTSEGKKDKQNFFVPGINESMRIMFHSCNGFSVGTDEKAWSGPALWNDVQRVHKESPFHVM